MNLQTLTPPSGEPLPMADAKAFTRIGADFDDALIGRLIAAARARIEAETGMALMRRTLRLTLNDWPLYVLERGGLRLPMRPAAGLLAVRLTDGETNEDVTSSFELEAGLSPRVVTKPFGAWVWPRTIHQKIEIDWEAGFDTASDVPEDLVHAMKLIVAFVYEQRGNPAVSAHEDLSERLEATLRPWREVQL